MRVEVSPREVELRPGLPVSIQITIANTSTVIGGYVVRVLGADPSWVELEAERISLFPDESRTLTATVKAPKGLAAGVRRIAVQVRELTPPNDNSIDDVDLLVPDASSMTARLDPLVVTAGRTGSFSVLIENTGNTVVQRRLTGEDPESKVEFRFEPEAVRLSPGEHAVVDLRVRARRHLLGSPTVRTFNLYLDEVPPDAFFEEPADGPAEPPNHDDQASAAIGTFVQRAALTRGPLSLLGLLAAVSVFAVVLTIAMSRLVGQSAADRNLALQVAAARNSGAPVGTSGLAGTVRSLTTGKPMQGVDVVLYSAANAAQPLITTATDTNGAYSITNLAAGSYKIEYQGAGLLTTWYPAASTPNDATKVTLAAKQVQNGLDVELGGVPASISGTVTGDDVSGATLYLETLPGGGGTSGAAAGARELAPGTTSSPPDDGLAVVQSVPIGSDGMFSLGNVPSPAIYTIVIVKTGYASARVQLDVGAGESRSGVNISLIKGDGQIAGRVTAGAGPLGDVTITATTGQTAVNTVSLTGTQAGTFVLRQLPTPATYTLTASATGYASQTLSVTLSAGQQLTGLAITLSSSSGSLSGLVSVAGAGGTTSPGTGVSVTVSNGELTVQTETETRGTPGAWTIGGLPVPGTYTVTFSRIDLATEIQSVSLDVNGHVNAGATTGTNIDAQGNILVRMKSATATIAGTISQPGGATVCDSSNDLGEATVTLSTGTSSYKVTTASIPAGRCGQYRVENLPAGTYTVTASAGSATAPQSTVVTVTAGDVLSGTTGVNLALPQPASMCGVVTTTDSPPVSLTGWTVDLYLQEDYPTQALQTTTTGSTACSADPGAFSFRDIPAGTYVVSVGPVPGNPVATLLVTVRPSQQATGVVIKVKQ